MSADSDPLAKREELRRWASAQQTHSEARLGDMRAKAQRLLAQLTLEGVLDLYPTLHALAEDLAAALDES